MKAILTKYHGPTNTRGSRISAEADGWGKVFVSYDHSLSGDAVRWVAAERLLQKAYKYRSEVTKMIAGGLPNGDVVFVFCEPCSETFTLSESAS